MQNSNYLAQQSTLCFTFYNRATLKLFGGLKMEQLLWDFEETRRQLKKSVHGMRWLIRQRALLIVRIRGRIYFQPAEIRKWVEEHSIPAYEGNIKNG